ncbi:MAG: sulfite exporter TauE/SafE family protein [Betaproteobacteria bacterium]
MEDRRALGAARVIDWSLLPLYVTLGAVVGFLAGLLGIGGGFTIVPVLMEAFTYEGFATAHVLPLAIGTSSATIVFTALSSARAHHLRGAVDWSIVRALAPGLVVGSLIGPQIASVLPMRVLAFLVGVVIWTAGLRMFLHRPPLPTGKLPGKGVMFAVGAGIGMVAGMAGAAGAFLAVPFMVRCNVKVHTAVATSAAIGWPVAVAATISYVVAGLRQANLPAYSLGYVYLPALAGVAVASVMLAPIGARVAHAWPVARLRRAFSLLLFVLGAYMLWKALRG